MRVEAVSDGVILTAFGAEVDALYRAYLEAYGPHDRATREAFASAANRREHWDRLDAREVESVAAALEDAWMTVTADRVRVGWFAWT